MKKFRFDPVKTTPNPTEQVKPSSKPKPLSK